MGTSSVENRIVPLAACRPHPFNYNEHDALQIEYLRESLRTFGQVHSVVVQDDGVGEYVIVAGEGVCTAARAEAF